MANLVAPFGFRPVRHTNGSAWNGQTVACLVDSGDGTAIFVGDIVKPAGSSGIAGQVVAGMDVEGMMTVILDTSTTTGQTILGVVTGFSVDPTNRSLKHRAASTSRIAYVCTDPTVVYQVQEDALVTPVAGASVGLCAAIVNTAGNTTTGVSKQVLDSDSVNTTATLPLKILGLSKIVGNALNTGGAGVDTATFDVVFNTGYLMPNIAGL